MESFLFVINIGNTFSELNKILITVAIIIVFATYFGFAVRNATDFIISFVLCLSLVFYNKKPKIQELPCSPGRKKRDLRARIDVCGDATRLQDTTPSKDNVEINADITDKVLPEVPDPPKKTKRRHKRRTPNKSKFKAMDDSSETSSNSDLSTKSDTQPEKTKVYAPLAILDSLNVNGQDLYYEFQKYLLTKEQLKTNSFPQESPYHPDRAILNHPKMVRNSTERRCCRCTSIFHVLPDGQYEAMGPCQYHAKKQIPFCTSNPHRGEFPCCNGNYISKGCMTWQFHVTQESALQDVKFVKTKHKKHLTREKAGTVYALDCEMVYTTAGMEVAKVGLVGVDGLTIYETFVLPQNPILDYNTMYSGITENHLKEVTVTLVDVQTFLLKTLNRDSILVGHGLENDLRALRLIHDNVVDTSVVFPHEHTRYYKRSLRNLAQEFLHKQIQQSIHGHNCIEDARTCLELMLLKISKDLDERLPQDISMNCILQNRNYNLSPARTESNEWNHPRPFVKDSQRVQLPSLSHRAFNWEDSEEDDETHHNYVGTQWMPHYNLYKDQYKPNREIAARCEREAAGMEQMERIQMEKVLGQWTSYYIPELHLYRCSYSMKC